LKYSYSLEYKKRPDYSYIRWLLKKILLDRNYVPDCQYDWSLAPGMSFQMVDPTDKHSSISSQGIGSDEGTDCNHAERLVHIMEIQGKYG
jgi:hypothetical protein